MFENVEQNKVSIIIAMYNSELYIERCINSLLNQTYHDIEIIVVDDGSSDSSGKVIKNISKDHNKIKYIYQNNSGPGVARNKGIEHATGKYLLFVDSDDYLSEDYVESMAICAEKNNSELVIAGYTLVYENSSKEKSIVPERYEKKKAEEWAYRISSCCSRLYLKTFWDKSQLKFNIERNARAEDVPIALYSNAMAKNIAIVKNPGYYYYQHQGSAMNNRKKRVLFEFPYVAFEETCRKVLKSEVENGIHFFYIGVLKFLAHFRYVIYLRASKGEKRKFYEYIERILGDTFETIEVQWKKKKKEMELPYIHKMAIEVFILEYKQRIKSYGK